MIKCTPNLIGNPAVLKQVNMVRILSHLRFDGPTSRAALARATGLDAKTITNVCNSLFSEGLITASEAKAAGRGRPAEAIAIKHDAAFSIGIDIGATQVSAVLMNLAGHIECQKRQEFGTCKDAKFLVRHAKDLLKGLQVGVSTDWHKKLRGVGICVPGFLDRLAGIVLDSVNIEEFAGVKLKEIIEESGGLPVMLEEASRSAAMAEIWFDRRELCTDFICVDMGFGIGAGIVHGGLLYRGAHEAGGEIGHTVVVPNGTNCSCGKRGCLETVVSGHALQAVAQKLKTDVHSKSYGGKALYEAASAGDIESRQELNRVGHFIGVAVANAINLFDPSMVILNGGLIKAGTFILEPLKAAINEHCIKTTARNYSVEISNLGEFAGAMGAGMLPLKHFFEFENIRF